MISPNNAVALPVHGGDVMAYRTRYGPGDWLDFSANINPAGPPAAVLAALRRALADPTNLIEYPTGRERRLAEKIAAMHGVDASQIVLANGAAALIEAFVRTVKPRSCLLPQPAFSEYERALQAEACRIVHVPLTVERDFQIDVDACESILSAGTIDALIITNPHNPSGSSLGAAEISRLIDYCRERKIALLLDEAFIDYCPEHAVSALADADETTFIVRSLTKFYAIPGLRVGYGIAGATLAERIRRRIPSWPMSALAIEAALAALDDEHYRIRAIQENRQRRAELAQKLTQLGCRVVPSAANFLLFSTTISSNDLADYLARHHRIIVRDCASYAFEAKANYLRIAVRNELDNARLCLALGKSLEFVAEGDARAGNQVFRQ